MAEESDKQKVLIVIPARGGSKGIPRKNLRPLCGQPLIAYAIKAALGAKAASRVVVSTEDDEIEFFARKYGSEVLRRPMELSDDRTALDAVVVHAVNECERKWNESYSFVVTVQPTSPLVIGADIDEAIEALVSGASDTVISAIDDRHLRWVKGTDGNMAPDYKERVNRQYMAPAFRETGAILACRREVINSGTRVSKNVSIFPMPPERSVDVDSYADLWLCEYFLKRKRIVITVAGNREVGLGHAHRCLVIAHELTKHDVVFVCTTQDDLAAQLIGKSNYRVETCERGSLLDKVLSLRPDMVINDVLDTGADYVTALKKSKAIVVNFEDMGLGAEVADLVINALYPHQLPNRHILVGARYFCLRDEFLVPHRGRSPLEEVKRAIVLFGGVDEGDLTGRTLGAVGKELLKRGTEVDVILGHGYGKEKELGALIKSAGLTNVNLVTATPRISDYMAKADFAITSAGRTVLELASLRVPMIVVCQNQRETTHTFASSENGIINMGLRHNVRDSDLLGAVQKVLNDPVLRKTMHDRLEKLNLRDGKKRVIRKITGLFEREDAVE